MSQCECATKYEWLPEMLTLEHHPLCRPITEFTLEGFFPKVDPVWNFPERHKAFEPSTSAELIGLMEQMFERYPIMGTSKKAPTGEDYITFTLGGEIKEGANAPLIATSDEAACKYFWLAFVDYALPRWHYAPESTLYWREKPRVVQEPSYINRYLIWARFLLSTAPIK